MNASFPVDGETENGYTYCAGCNTWWVDTGCGQLIEHERCPKPCGLCGKPIRGLDVEDDPKQCRGHMLEEVLEATRKRRGKQ